MLRDVDDVVTDTIGMDAIDVDIDGVVVGGIVDVVVGVIVALMVVTVVRAGGVTDEHTRVKHVHMAAEFIEQFC